MKSNNIKGLFGIKPSGNIHIGHVKIINKARIAKSKFLIADLHSRTDFSKKNNLFSSKTTIYQLIALGVSPDDIYLQSNIKQLGDLLWYFSCFIKLPQLTRMHLYKHLEAIKETMYVSELYYPILMLTDILLADSNTIFIGEDQIAHIELYNDFINTIKIGNKVQYNASPCIEGIDGRKMSKSYHNTISYFDSESVIKMKIMSIKTANIPLRTTESRQGPLFSIEINALDNIIGIYLNHRRNLYRLSFLEEKQLFLHFFLQKSRQIKNNFNDATKISYDDHFVNLDAQNRCYQWINKMKTLLKL